jgi:hypothetical protein
MLRIIYGVLPLVIWICSMASVIWLLSSFVGFELLLVAGGCFVAFASSVTLAEEASPQKCIAGPKTITAARCLGSGCHLHGRIDG